LLQIVNGFNELMVGGLLCSRR